MGVSPSPTSSTPRRFRAALHRRRAPKLKEGIIPEVEGDGAVVNGEIERALEKNFGCGKNFAAKFEDGKEVDRGHFGHSCPARAKKGEIKGQFVAVKIMAKILMETGSKTKKGSVGRMGGGTKKKVLSRSSKAGLQVPVGRIDRFLKKGRFTQRVGSSAPVFLAAILEFLASITAAHYMFDEIPHSDTFAWNSFFAAHLTDHDSLHAPLVYRHLLCDTHPDRHTLPHVLSAFGLSSSTSTGLQAHALALKLNLSSDPYVLTPSWTSIFKLATS